MRLLARIRRHRTHRATARTLRSVNRHLRRADREAAADVYQLGDVLPAWACIMRSKP